MNIDLKGWIGLVLSAAQTYKSFMTTAALIGAVGWLGLQELRGPDVGPTGPTGSAG